MLLADKINLAIAIAAGLSVVASCIMAAMTLSIVKANRATVEIMRAQIDAASRPYIQIAPIVRPMTTAVELRIRNVGSTSANRLRLSFDKDYQFNAEEGQHKNIRSYAAFTKEIQMFAPGAELRFLLGVGHRILTNNEICPLLFSVTAEYGYETKRVVEVTTVDLEAFGKSVQPVEPLIERMDKLIAEIALFREQLSSTNG